MISIELFGVTQIALANEHMREAKPIEILGGLYVVEKVEVSYGQTDTRPEVTGSAMLKRVFYHEKKSLAFPNSSFNNSGKQEG